MAKDKKPFSGTAIQGFLILDGDMQLWTSAVFHTPAHAANYMQDKTNLTGVDLSKNTIVPCTALLRVAKFD